MYMVSFRLQVNQYRKAAVFSELPVEQTVMAYMEEHTSASDGASPTANLILQELFIPHSEMFY